MSNTITAFLERLVSRSGEFNAAKVSKLSYLGAVYLNVEPEVARNGQVIRIPFPDVGAVTDQAGNDWTPEDVTPNYADLTFQYRPGKALLFRDYELMQIASDPVTLFMDPMFKRTAEYLNGQVAALITTGNFNSYAAIQCLTPGSIGVRDATRAWKALAGGKVPVGPTQRDNLAILTHSDVHAEMLNDSQWTQESLVSAAIARAAREDAELGSAFSFQKLWDQQAPVTQTALTGTVAVSNGSATVTGTGTSFTTQLAAYNTIVFANDPTGTPYRVLSVASDTSATLTSNFAAASITGSAATASVYTSVAMHRYAIALGLRPLELVNDGTTQSRLVMFGNVPIRVQVSYQHLKGGYLVSCDVGCAVGVIRKDFGIVLKS